MANDFKRMWTKEEIDNTYVLNAGDFDVNGEKIITKNEALNISKHRFIKVIGVNGTDYAIYTLATSQYVEGAINLQYIYDDSENVYYVDVYDTYEPMYKIKVRKGKNINEYDYEQLVKAVPTEVSIFEDQGKLELMLEHDGNVLAVNDTPNQFLQRRLDKPSAEWNSETSSVDFETWLNEQTFRIGEIVWLDINEGDFIGYCMVTNTSGGSLTLSPITALTMNYGFVFDIIISTTNFNNVSLTKAIDFNGSTTNTSYTRNDIFWFRKY